MYHNILSTADLAGHLDDSDWRLLDCRFELARPTWGEEQYRHGHIPGALYAHLERDLSGPIRPDSGRHPLPELPHMVETLRRWGITQHSQVVVYDQAGGAFAARAWWMLRYLGHEAVAVLDGGYAKWLAEGHPTQSALTNYPKGDFEPHPRPEMLLSTQELLALLNNPAVRLVDARAPERYRGETEPIDTLAGHIPGAVNRFHGENLGPGGLLKEVVTLRAEYLRLLDDAAPEQAVMYCGSGVTSCHNLLAMSAAGLPLARLYLGSWSEWIRDPARPTVPPR